MKSQIKIHIELKKLWLAKEHYKDNRDNKEENDASYIN